MSNTTPTETATEETAEEMPEEGRSGEKEEKKKATRRPRKEKPPKEPRVKKWADDPIAYCSGTTRRRSRSIWYVRSVRRNLAAYVLISIIRSITRVAS